ncbi:TPA: hypothetical protein ACHFNM_003587 [Enterobacter hormaechei]|uniref:hypothetical protein n=1 Tax=Enterobacter hormaechei TaxID=158836 RepID=UPI000DCBACD2|nr:hypothetical protein [Enterobacter hormaechei]RAZ40527.1 hypothetical protein DP192_15180 [Enterobacter hormaechei subsp. xiangfangensis]
MTANKPMTSEQLEELMTIAVNMQRDSEKVSDRPAAMFAYAVQVAVLELRKVRNEAAALAAENGQMLRLLTDISENHDEYVNLDEYLYAGIPMDYVSEINSYVSRDVEAENPFKETDAFLAEVRAQVWIEGNEPAEFGRYWVRYETDVGPRYCSAQWMEHNFCAGSDTNIHRIWLADHSRSINSLRGVTHYTKLPDSLEAAQ